jgi:hypothetical protein
MTRSKNENGQTTYRLPRSKLLTADVMSTRRTAAAGKRSRASHAGPRRTSSKWRRLYKAAAPRTFQPRIADARCRISPAGARSGARLRPERQRRLRQIGREFKAAGTRPVRKAYRDPG